MRLARRLLDGLLLAAGGLAIGVGLVVFALVVVYWIGRAL